ncbi:uncharacterized protein MONOS_11849 [Monocercomonoides exilis]|uniref:uncharacterized protein n=1 Tax=Monocercomonoides exilis TaxID=2049356 RepID=UPI00355AB3B4|nr:hypothetical protein MONOS_11849 [Monocercomonoides exilis]|eukprot:MONOS_11849.1-p1 / transcript=MONOS_11849.1 / gene=MONOS_11849 / organism=Monocercomonoides_exilis_PA203 / gene_product=unspecified product / transcript_product=unspecified product / location=Mono_scaffold00618:8361-13828(+) / protein_length=1793 / sequence_SO=supercontig / SO=protein_coding / is_pseudo=false
MGKQITTDSSKLKSASIVQEKNVDDDLHLQNSSEIQSENAAPQINEKSATKKVVLLGLSFCCIFIATQTSLNYMTTFFADYASIVLCLYGVVNAIYGLLCPVVKHYIGIIGSFRVAAIAGLIFVAMCLFCLIVVFTQQSLPTFGIVLLFIGAVFYGMSYATLWFCWSAYMDEITTIDTRGKLSGLFYAIFYANSPLGNFLGSILFSVGFEKYQMLIVLTAFCVIGVVLMFFVRTNSKKDEKHEPQKSSSTKNEANDNDPEKGRGTGGSSNIRDATESPAPKQNDAFVRKDSMKMSTTSLKLKGKHYVSLSDFDGTVPVPAHSHLASSSTASNSGFSSSPSSAASIHNMSTVSSSPHVSSSSSSTSPSSPSAAATSSLRPPRPTTLSSSSLAPHSPSVTPQPSTPSLALNPLVNQKSHSTLPDALIDEDREGDADADGEGEGDQLVVAVVGKSRSKKRASNAAAVVGRKDSLADTSKESAIRAEDEDDDDEDEDEGNDAQIVDADTQKKEEQVIKQEPEAEDEDDEDDDDFEDDRDRTDENGMVDEIVADDDEELSEEDDDDQNNQTLRLPSSYSTSSLSRPKLGPVSPDPAESPAPEFSPKEYFRDLWEIILTPGSYPVCLAYSLYHLIGCYLVSVMTKHLTPEQQGLFVGIGFGLSGIFLMIGSIAFGHIVDKFSKRTSLFINFVVVILTIISAWVFHIVSPSLPGFKVFMFCLTLCLYGFENSGLDVNFFWLSIETNKMNPMAYFQYCRVFSNGTYGIVGLISQWLWNEPFFFLILNMFLTFVVMLLMWNTDVTVFSFSKMTKEALIKEIIRDPTQLQLTERDVETIPIVASVASVHHLQAMERLSSLQHITSMKRIERELSHQMLPKEGGTLSRSNTRGSMQRLGSGMMGTNGTMSSASMLAMRGSQSQLGGLGPYYNPSYLSLARQGALSSSTLSMTSLHQQQPHPQQPRVRGRYADQRGALSSVTSLSTLSNDGTGGGRSGIAPGRVYADAFSNGTGGAVTRQRRSEMGQRGSSGEIDARAMTSSSLSSSFNIQSPASETTDSSISSSAPLNSRKRLQKKKSGGNSPASPGFTSSAFSSGSLQTAESPRTSGQMDNRSEKAKLQQISSKGRLKPKAGLLGPSYAASSNTAAFPVAATGTYLSSTIPTSASYLGSSFALGSRYGSSALLMTTGGGAGNVPVPVPVPIPVGGRRDEGAYAPSVTSTSPIHPTGMSLAMSSSFSSIPVAGHAIPPTLEVMDGCTVDGTQQPMLVEPAMSNTEKEKKTKKGKKGKDGLNRQGSQAFPSGSPSASTAQLHTSASKNSRMFQQQSSIPSSSSNLSRSLSQYKSAFPVMFPPSISASNLMSSLAQSHPVLHRKTEETLPPPLSRPAITTELIRKAESEAELGRDEYTYEDERESDDENGEVWKERINEDGSRIEEQSPQTGQDLGDENRPLRQGDQKPKANPKQKRIAGSKSRSLLQPKGGIRGEMGLFVSSQSIGLGMNERVKEYQREKRREMERKEEVSAENQLVQQAMDGIGMSEYDSGAVVIGDAVTDNQQAGIGLDVVNEEDEREAYEEGEAGLNIPQAEVGGREEEEDDDDDDDESLAADDGKEAIELNEHNITFFPPTVSFPAFVPVQSSQQPSSLSASSSSPSSGALSSETTGANIPSTGSAISTSGLSDSVSSQSSIYPQATIEPSADSMIASPSSSALPSTAASDPFSDLHPMLTAQLVSVALSASAETGAVRPSFGAPVQSSPLVSIPQPVEQPETFPTRASQAQLQMEHTNNEESANSATSDEHAFDGKEEK